MQPLTEKEIERLTNCLNRTQSDFDGEALNAIRAANGILTRKGLRWETMLSDQESFDLHRFDPVLNLYKGLDETQRQKIKVLEAEIASLRKRIAEFAGADDTTIPEALDFLLSVVKPSSFRNTLLSIQEHWCERGALTEKQRKVIGDAFERHNPRLAGKRPTWA